MKIMATSERLLTLRQLTQRLEWGPRLQRLQKNQKGENGLTETTYKRKNKDNLDNESIQKRLLLVLESNHQWEYIYAWMKREKIEAKLKVTRDGGL